MTVIRQHQCVYYARAACIGNYSCRVWIAVVWSINRIVAQLEINLMLPVTRTVEWLPVACGYCR
jgi:hypothetical protein